VVNHSALVKPKLLHMAVLLSIASILLFRELGAVPIFSRGEGREALVVWEMSATGNWILPVVNGEYIPFKPPLFHWFGVVAGYLFDRIDEFTLRLPSAMFAAAGVLLTYLTAARLWNQRAGLIAAIVLATSAEWWQAGTSIQVDMTLAFFIVAACLYFCFLYEQPELGLAKCLGLPVLLGLATLAKGPLGVVIPSVVIVVFLALRHDLGFVKRLHLFASAAVFLLVAGTWYGLALHQGGAAFFLRQIIDENFRTAAGTYGHYQPPYYYLPILLLNALPWSIFFPALAVFIYQRRASLADEQLLFPLIWVASVFIFFSLSLGKRGVYILPLYPAMALLFGAWWDRLERGEVEHAWLTRVIGFCLAIACALSLAIVGIYAAASYGLPGQTFAASIEQFKDISRTLQPLLHPSQLVVACFALYTVSLVYLIWALLKKDWRRTFASITLIAIAISLMIESVILSPIAFERTMKPFMARVAQNVDANSPLLFYRAFDRGAVFYAHRHIPHYAEKAGELKPPFFLLMREEDWKPLETRPELRMLDISEGIGPAGRHRLVLVEYQSTSATANPLPAERAGDLPGADRD
jgi:4-amino-4-deoxy-L-arabinose transferase-like glycosyltransferase